MRRSSACRRGSGATVLAGRGQSLPAADGVLIGGEVEMRDRFSRERREVVAEG
jgi:hypothetical protein